MSYLILDIRSIAKEGDVQAPKEMVERVHAILHETRHYVPRLA